ncbi:MAG: hypothetical protein JWO65_2181 [Sphingomonas bacterium]|nr:hypothetical protein [Sphingomonas bacterium]
MPASTPANNTASKAVAVEVRAQVGGRLKAFYGPRGYWPMWVRGGGIGPEAATLLDLLASADLDGLEPKGYNAPRLRALIVDARDGTPKALAKAEIGLSQAFADYVRDVRRPVAIGTTYLDPELKPERLRPDAILRAAALPASFTDYVRQMGWMSPLYVRLRAALAGYHSSAEGERILRLNLDRARMLPGPWTRHVVVDAASARLYYYQDGKQQATMRVVVGTPETQTPMLAGMVRYAILNPYWNVPPDLVTKRIAPKILAGASLASLRYQALADWSVASPPRDPSTIDWHAVAAGEQEVRIRQLPGGANAMGKVKFVFPNDQGIYLHDTPDKALMTKSARHLSNGCVRLEDAPALGRLLFGKPLSSTSKAPEQDVPLPRPVPVYLTYLTASPTAKGVDLLTDVYHRDGGLADGRAAP